MTAVLALVIAAVGTQLALGTMEPRWKPLSIALGATVVVLIVPRPAGQVDRAIAGAARCTRNIARPTPPPASRSTAWLEQTTAALRRQAGRGHRPPQDGSQRRQGQVRSHPRQGQGQARRRPARRPAGCGRQGGRGRGEARPGQHRKPPPQLERHLADIAQKRARSARRAGAIRIVRSRHAAQVRGRRCRPEAAVHDGIASIQAPIQDRSGQSTDAFRPWDDPFWKNFKPTKTFAEMVRFGDMKVDLQQHRRQRAAARRFEAATAAAVQRAGVAGVSRGRRRC